MRYSKNIVSQSWTLYVHSVFFLEFYQFYWLSNACGSGFVTVSVTARDVTHLRDIVTLPNPTITKLCNLIAL